MEKEKYYVPTIEEFHVGFEFEYKGVPSDLESNGGYIKSVFDLFELAGSCKPRLCQWPWNLHPCLTNGTFDSCGSSSLVKKMFGFFVTLFLLF
jgi:hypothetical protein